ncbi:MAG: ABC transporter substrate-binding protein [Azospirillaceae bacterium]
MPDTTSRLTLSRRTALKGIGAGSAALAASSFPMPAIGQSLRPVTLVYGVQTVDVSTGFFSSIPMHFGFYEEEGLEVEIQSVSGSSAALNVLAADQAQVSSHGSAGMFAGVGRGVDMQSFICQIPDYFVSVGVAADSPFQSFEDLRGQTIGISAEGGSPHLVMSAIFSNLGWVEGEDFEYLAVGTALPALDALQRDRVQALALWDTIFAGFEFQGQEFRHFRPDPIPSLGFTHSSNAMRSTIENEPEMIAGLTRAMNKAIVVMAAAEQDELTKLHYQVFPESEPTGMSEEESLRMSRLRMEARKPNMRLEQRVFEQTERLGDITDSQIAGHRDLLASGGSIPEALPVDRYFTREFLDYGNDFDIDALIEQARDFRAE